MSDEQRAEPVVVPWRHLRGIAMAYYAVPFAVALMWLAATSVAFQPVHRAIMGSFALLIGYFVAVHLTNTTTLSVRGGRLVVKHGPLPWRGAMSIPLDAIGRVRLDRPGRRIQVRTKQGEELNLLDGIPSEAADQLDAALKSLHDPS